MAQLEHGQLRKTPASIESADAIVVLSGMITTVRGENGIISEWGDPDRFFGGVELIKAGKAPHMIFTRGKVPWESQSNPEGEVLRQYALELGVPEQKILLTDEVVNTAQEAQATRRLLSEINQPKIILVTSAFHMPRSKRLFENEGFIVIPYPVDFKFGIKDITAMSFLPTAGGLGQTSLFIREMIGRTYYRLRELI